MGITRVTIWVIGFLTYLRSPPDPASKSETEAEQPTGCLGAVPHHQPVIKPWILSA